MSKVLLSRLRLVLIAALLVARCEARNIDHGILEGFNQIIGNDYYAGPGSSCKCYDISCECCSIVGPSKMCNTVKLLNAANKADLALELSVHIGNSQIFSQNVTLRELEPICYTYGNYNLCVEVNQVKSQQEDSKVCGNFLAKQKSYDDNVQDSILAKTEIFCLPFETHQLNKHVLQLLRYVSQ